MMPSPRSEKRQGWRSGEGHRQSREASGGSLGWSRQGVGGAGPRGVTGAGVGGAHLGHLSRQRRRLNSQTMRAGFVGSRACGRERV